MDWRKVPAELGFVVGHEIGAGGDVLGGDVEGTGAHGRAVGVPGGGD